MNSAATPASSDGTSPEYRVFCEVAELSGASRVARLAELCQGDSTLEQRVTTLLQHDASPTLRDDALAAFFEPSEPDWTEGMIGSQVGGYVLKRVLGRGGMGAVFEAEQQNPARAVAVKFLVGRHLHPSAWKRFDREVRVAASLQHPGIARVLEAGSLDTPAGALPWYSMELVQGPSLESFVAQRGTDLRGRVRLLAEVGEALEFAHQRGIVHRDLKPANILVDTAVDPPRPRILDFGVAKETASDHGALTLQTEIGQVIGTLQYMSPEQVAGRSDQVDARSDVYSLGIVAFELLVGSRPYELAGLPLGEAARRIGSIDAPPLRRALPGAPKDLECVIMKALAKDRERRYADAGAFAADLRRWLSHEAILARPPTIGYRLNRFVRRNPGLVGGLSLAFLALLSGLIATNAARIESEAARRDSDEQRRVALDHSRAARFHAYASQIAAADAALLLGNTKLARERLEAAEPELRGWEWRHVSARLDESLGLRVTGNLSALSATRNFELVAAVRDGQSVEVWESTGTEWKLRWSVATTAVHPHASAFDPEGHRLLVMDNYAGGATIFSVEDGRTLQVVRGHRDRVYAAVWLPGAREILTASEDGTVARWDAETGLRTGSVEIASVRALVVIEGADPLAVAASRSGLHYLEIPSLTVRSHIPWNSPMAGVSSLDYRGRYAAVLDGKSFRLLQSTGDQRAIEFLNADYVHSAFSPDGKRVLAGGRDGTIDLLRTDDGAQLQSLMAHRSGVSGLVWDHSNPSRIISSGNDGIREWDLNHSEGVVQMSGHFGDCMVRAMATDAPIFATIDGRDRTIRVFSAENACPLGILWEGPPLGLALSPGGDRLALSHPSGGVSVHDLVSQQTIHRFESEAALGLRFDPDCGQFCAVSAIDGSRLVFLAENPPRTERGNCLTPGAYAAVAADSLGRGYISKRVIADDSVELRWHPSTPEARPVPITCPRPLRSDLASRLHATWSRDGKRIAVEVEEDLHLVLNGSDGSVLQTLADQTLFSSTISPDGSRLALGYRDGRIILHDTDHQLPVAVLSGHADWTASLMFSPDGTALIGTWPDGSIRIFDTKPVRERRPSRREARRVADQAQEHWTKRHRPYLDPRETMNLIRAESPASNPDQMALLTAGSVFMGTMEGLSARGLAALGTEIDSEPMQGALHSLSAILRNGSADRRAFAVTAALALEAGNPDKARSLFASAEAAPAQNHGDTALLHYLRVRAFLRLGTMVRARDAMDDLRALLEVAPPDAAPEVSHWLRTAESLLPQ